MKTRLGGEVGGRNTVRGLLGGPRRGNGRSLIKAVALRDGGQVGWPEPGY